MKKLLVILLVLFSIIPAKPKTVKVGADVLFESRFDLIKGKRVGLITNHSALLSNGKHLADALVEHKNVKLVVLFGPEHGVRGDAPDGRTVHDTLDEKTGVPVFSLYGKTNKPTKEMLKDVDVLVYDIQDVGVRFYTFISTMFLCMESAAENHIPFIVLDRPNPIDGVTLDGPIRNDSLKSFVGWAPIPIRYGMTIGELAVMANLSGWLENREKAELTVVTMKNWKRGMWYDQTTLRWVKPSPNIKDLATATVYPGTCMIEGTNLSEGRGTDRPFEYIGAPWVDGKKLSKELSSYKLPGAQFESIEFTPKEIPNVASNPKYKDRQCGGIYIRVTNRNKFQAVRTGLAVVFAAHKLFPDSLAFREKGFDRLMGTPVPRQMLQNGSSVGEIVATWEPQLKEFMKQRKKALLYLK